MQIEIPYLTLSSRKDDEAGHPALGWSRDFFDVPEADPSEFKLATSKYIDRAYSKCTWAGRDSHWTGALSYYSPNAIGRHDVCNEYRVGALRDEIVALKNCLGLAQARAFRAEFKTTGRVLRVTNDGVAGTRTTLKPGDGREKDRAAAEEWVGRNLVSVQGSILKRTLEPSVVISWTWSSHALSASSTFAQREFWPTADSFMEEPGLHYSCLDDQFHDDWREIMDAFPGNKSPLIGLQEYAMQREMLDAEIRRMRQSGDPRTILGIGTMCFDPEALSSVPADPEVMSRRTILSFARNLVRKHSPHLQRKGEKRDALFAMKALLEDGAGDDHVVEGLGMAMARLPGSGEPFVDWFVGKALDMWQRREIGVSPVFHATRTL